MPRWRITYLWMSSVGKIVHPKRNHALHVWRRAAKWHFQFLLLIWKKYVIRSCTMQDFWVLGALKNNAKNQKQNNCINNSNTSWFFSCSNKLARSASALGSRSSSVIGWASITSWRLSVPGIWSVTRPTISAISAVTGSWSVSPSVTAVATGSTTIVAATAASPAKKV